MPNELMTIGTFSMLTGMSIPTLRHYDDIGLLRPAEVDSRTGYRRYRSTQVDVARRVRLLRDAKLSTEDIARVINGDASDAREVLTRQRAALHERAGRVEALLDQLAHDIEGIGTQMKTATDFRLVAVNIGVDSDSALEAACAFWGGILGTQLENWGTPSRQVVLGEGDAIGFLNIRVRSPEEPHYGHTSAFGLGVVGLDETHQRALAAGATEHYPPTDGENMPRHSLIADPVGNRVVLWESSK
ncbi:MerR family transcriptional regulator [Actinopolymorpha alba]|uniref:MerR family transcriptional regulator n=1 Tax=Actinopolymorpha alba TaxID=533267 RepID=UPI0003744317|nr:MerR family transcriptional regulator [Actinopolymorpha alba]